MHRPPEKLNEPRRACSLGEVPTFTCGLTGAFCIRVVRTASGIEQLVVNAETHNVDVEIRVAYKKVMGDAAAKGTCAKWGTPREALSAHSSMAAS